MKAPSSAEEEVRWLTAMSSAVIVFVPTKAGTEGMVPPVTAKPSLSQEKANVCLREQVEVQTQRQVILQQDEPAEEV